MSAEEVMKYKVDDFAKHIVDKIWEAQKIKVYKKNFCLITADNDEVRFSYDDPLSRMIAVYHPPGLMPRARVSDPTPQFAVDCRCRGE